MILFILLLIALYVVIGFIGAVVHGLIWLTVVAGVLFLLTIFFGGSRVGRNRAQR